MATMDKPFYIDWARALPSLRVDPPADPNAPAEDEFGEEYFVDPNISTPEQIAAAHRAFELAVRQAVFQSSFATYTYFYDSRHVRGEDTSGLHEDHDTFSVVANANSNDIIDLSAPQPNVRILDPHTDMALDEVPGIPVIDYTTVIEYVEGSDTDYIIYDEANGYSYTFTFDAETRRYIVTDTETGAVVEQTRAREQFTLNEDGTVSDSAGNAVTAEVRYYEDEDAFFVPAPDSLVLNNDGNPIAINFINGGLPIYVDIAVALIEGLTNPTSVSFKVERSDNGFIIRGVDANDALTTLFTGVYDGNISYTITDATGVDVPAPAPSSLRTITLSDGETTVIGVVYVLADSNPVRPTGSTYDPDDMLPQSIRYVIPILSDGTLAERVEFPITFSTAGTGDYFESGINVRGVSGSEIEGRGGHDDITGTDGDDTIYGDFKDVLETATDGNDYIRGLGGDDTIDGGSQGDYIFGGEGDDNIDGGNGYDYVDGGVGDDFIRGGNGEDIIIGGAGDDNIDGGNGRDRIFGGDGDDDIQGGRFDDAVDVIYGGAGDDEIYVDGGGNNYLYGGTGNDIIRGGHDNDEIRGGLGNDRIILSRGANDDVWGNGIKASYYATTPGSGIISLGINEITSIARLLTLENNGKPIAIDLGGGALLAYTDIAVALIEGLANPTETSFTVQRYGDNGLGFLIKGITDGVGETLFTAEFNANSGTYTITDASDASVATPSNPRAITIGDGTLSGLPLLITNEIIQVVYGSDGGKYTIQYDFDQYPADLYSQTQIDALTEYWQSETDSDTFVLDFNFGTTNQPRAMTIKDFDPTDILEFDGDLADLRFRSPDGNFYQQTLGDVVSTNDPSFDLRITADGTDGTSQYVEIEHPLPHIHISHALGISVLDVTQLSTQFSTQSAILRQDDDDGIYYRDVINIDEYVYDPNLVPLSVKSVLNELDPPNGIPNPDYPDIRTPTVVDDIEVPKDDPSDPQEFKTAYIYGYSNQALPVGLTLAVAAIREQVKAGEFGDFEEFHVVRIGTTGRDWKVIASAGKYVVVDADGNAVTNPIAPTVITLADAPNGVIANNGKPINIALDNGALPDYTDLAVHLAKQAITAGTADSIRIEAVSHSGDAGGERFQILNGDTDAVLYTGTATYPVVTLMTGTTADTGVTWDIKDADGNTIFDVTRDLSQNTITATDDEGNPVQDFDAAVSRSSGDFEPITIGDTGWTIGHWDILNAYFDTLSEKRQQHQEQLRTQLLTTIKVDADDSLAIDNGDLDLDIFEWVEYALDSGDKVYELWLTNRYALDYESLDPTSYSVDLTLTREGGDTITDTININVNDKEESADVFANRTQIILSVDHIDLQNEVGFTVARKLADIAHLGAALEDGHEYMVGNEELFEIRKNDDGGYELWLKGGVFAPSIASHDSSVYVGERVFDYTRVAKIQYDTTLPAFDGKTYIASDSFSVTARDFHGSDMEIVGWEEGFEVSVAVPVLSGDGIIKSWRVVKKTTVTAPDGNEIPTLRPIYDKSTGNDVINGNGEDNQIDGKSGNDTIYGRGGDDIIDGGNGNDILYGNDGDDTIYGGNRHDFIRGNKGNDILDGGKGRDVLMGGQGSDQLFGGADGLNLDVLMGGAGSDFFYLDANHISSAGMALVTDFSRTDGDKIRINVDDPDARAFSKTGSGSVAEALTEAGNFIVRIVRNWEESVSAGQNVKWTDGQSYFRSAHTEFYNFNGDGDRYVSSTNDENKADTIIYYGNGQKIAMVLEDFNDPLEGLYFETPANFFDFV